MSSSSQPNIQRNLTMRREPKAKPKPKLKAKDSDKSKGKGKGKGKAKATDPVDPVDPTATYTLTQIQYRSYVHEYAVYHFHAEKMDLDDLETYLTTVGIPLVQRLTSPPMLVQEIPDGDEVPEGKLEAVYIRDVFKVTLGDASAANRACGSALGFGSAEKVDWFAFAKPLDEYLEALVTDEDGNVMHDAELAASIAKDEHSDKNQVLLFDLVATIEKTDKHEKRILKGNDNHRAWFDLLDGVSSGGSSAAQPSIYAPLEKTYEKWGEFQEAGYDIKKFGYMPKLAKMVGRKNLLEDDSDQEEEDTEEEEGGEGQEDEQDEEDDAE